MTNIVTLSGREETVVRRAVEPTPEDLRCDGCHCTEPCSIARIVSELSHREAVALYRLGDVLDFSGPREQVSQLLRDIAIAMNNITVHEAKRILDQFAILPAPGSYTLAASGGGYAIIFVVGESYTTHPVVVRRS